MAARRPTSEPGTPSARRLDLAARPVSQIMSKPVLAVTADLRLGDALEAMVHTGLRHLVVVDQADRCLGVIADRAIAAAWAVDPTALSLMAVARAIDERPAVVSADVTVADVARAMYTDGVDAVAVIDRAGHAVGMVTGGDLVALLATESKR
jgi:CBS domain-containing protein